MENIAEERELSLGDAFAYLELNQEFTEKFRKTTQTVVGG